MGKQALSSEPIDENWIADLDRLASHFSCSREHLVATAVLRFVNDEIHAVEPSPPDLPPYKPTDPTAKALDEAEAAYADALEAFIKVGDDAIERGETFSHEEVVASLRSRYGRKHAA